MGALLIADCSCSHCRVFTAGQRAHLNMKNFVTHQAQQVTGMSAGQRALVFAVLRCLRTALSFAHRMGILDDLSSSAFALQPFCGGGIVSRLIRTCCAVPMVRRAAHAVGRS
eukprot:9482117-Pyramimonas_sp.AAC.1